MSRPRPEGVARVRPGVSVGVVFLARALDRVGIREGAGDRRQGADAEPRLGSPRDAEHAGVAVVRPRAPEPVPGAPQQPRRQVAGDSRARALPRFSRANRRASRADALACERARDGDRRDAFGAERNGADEAAEDPGATTIDDGDEDEEEDPDAASVLAALAAADAAEGARGTEDRAGGGARAFPWLSPGTSTRSSWRRCSCAASARRRRARLGDERLRRVGAPLQGEAEAAPREFGGGPPRRAAAAAGSSDAPPSLRRWRERSPPTRTPTR